MKKVFTSSQDAESAFYEALEQADLEAMMAVWSDDDEIVCVHPGGPRLAGIDAIRASWAELFGSDQKMRVKLTQPVHVQSGLYAIHSVHEVISTADGSRTAGPIVATNVYARTSSGWRMIVHHASPAPALPERAPDSPKTLH